VGGTIRDKSITPISKLAQSAKAIAPADVPTVATPVMPEPDRLMTLPSVPAFTPPAKFKRIEGFKAYAHSSGIAKLPAYRKQLEVAQEGLRQANGILTAHQQELGYPELVQRSWSAAAALDQAQHPMREEAAKTRAEAERLNEKMNSLAREASEAQSKADHYMRPVPPAVATTTNQSLKGAAADGFITAANLVAANIERQRAMALNVELAQVRAEYDAGIRAAMQLERTPGDPAQVAKASENLKAAQEAVHKADVQLAADVARQQRAKSTVDLAQANVNNLEAAKNYLGNFGDTFTMTSRLSLPKGWKDDLRQFMQELQ
jgi:hypothetical protein